jgi:2,3-bisphosphoglycerate-independent phosphoglycerate mutase
MDRDKRWDRTKIAFEALTNGVAPYSAPNAEIAVSEAYLRGETDEFVKPTIIIDSEGRPEATIRDNDSVIFFNFRPDRARQLTWAFVKENFEDFVREKCPKVYYVCMVQYDENLDLPIAFLPDKLKSVFGEVISKKGLIQLRIAETEKYAHVTFFLNGGQEKCYEGEDRCLIPSPKIATYDLKPEMSAYEVTDTVIRKIQSGKYDVIILNFANMDMVGHTGICGAAVKAIEAVDSCVGRVVAALKEKGGIALITADHGNAEQMIDTETGEPHTAHTSNPVRCIYVGNDEIKALKNGKLCDLAPTLLELLNVPKPQDMTGTTLILRD